jgi:hypothetical protein
MCAIITQLSRNYHAIITQSSRNHHAIITQLSRIEELCPQMRTSELENPCQKVRTGERARIVARGSHHHTVRREVVSRDKVLRHWPDERPRINRLVTEKLRKWHLCPVTKRAAVSSVSLCSCPELALTNQTLKTAVSDFQFEKSDDERCAGQKSHRVS